MRALVTLLPALVLFAGQALSQTTTDARTATNSPPLVLEEATEKAWAFSASVYTYVIPDDSKPTVVVAVALSF